MTLLLMSLIRVLWISKCIKHISVHSTLNVEHLMHAEQMLNNASAQQTHRYNRQSCGIRLVDRTALNETPYDARWACWGRCTAHQWYSVQYPILIWSSYDWFGWFWLSTTQWVVCTLKAFSGYLLKVVWFIRPACVWDSVSFHTGQICRISLKRETSRTLLLANSSMRLTGKLLKFF